MTGSPALRLSVFQWIRGAAGRSHGICIGRFMTAALFRPLREPARSGGRELPGWGGARILDFSTDEERDSEKPYLAAFFNYL